MAQINSFYSNISPHLQFDRTLGEYMNAEDTVRLIIDTVKTYALSPYIQNVVKVLSQGNPDNVEFCKRLFDVCCKNVEYLRDPAGHEIVFTPKLLMQVGKGDCKKFTTFIWSAMEAKGIQGAAKVVSYDGNNWAHIYMIEPTGSTYITLDPVNHCKYNSEVNYKKAQLFYLNGTKSQIMNKLSLMGSLGNLTPANLLNGVGNAADDILGDIDETFSGRRGMHKSKSCHNPAALSGLGNDYMNGVNDENETDEEGYLSGIDVLEGVYDDELSGLGKGLLKKAAAKVKAKVATVKKKAAAKKTVRQTKRAAKKTPEAKAKRKEKRKKLFKVGAKVAFVPMRAAFLAIIALGGALAHTPIKLNLAAKLAKVWQKDNGASIVKVWEQFGGKREALAKAISKASKVSISGNDVQVYPDGSFLSGLGVVTAAAAAATIAAATPITLAMIKMMKGKGEMTEGETEHVEDVSEVIEDAALQSSGGDVKQVLKKAAITQLVKQGAELDDGGNEATQADIVEYADSEPEVEGDSENFKPAVAKSGNAAARTVSKSAQQVTEDIEEIAPAAKQAPPEVEEPSSNPRNLPATKEQFAPKAKSILGGYKYPITWLKALLYCIMLSSIYNVNKVAATITGSLIFLILTLSIINLSIQKIKRYGKI